MRETDLLSGDAYYWSLDFSALNVLFYRLNKRNNGRILRNGESEK